MRVRVYYFLFSSYPCPKHLGLLLLLLRVPLKGLQFDYRRPPEKMLWAGHLLILLTNPILQMSERNVHSQGCVGQHITDPQPSSSITRLCPLPPSPGSPWRSFLAHHVWVPPWSLSESFGLSLGSSTMQIWRPRVVWGSLWEVCQRTLK